MNTTVLHDDPYPFENFVPTLSQCFVIVITGYLLARFEILRSSDVQGVNAFAAYFAMPGIICMSLMDADFDDFRWELLVGIFLGKFFIFCAVAGFLLLLDGNIGVAGTVALFCVHSNDLPVGNPLMSSLYKDHRPQMMKYLFLIPAMTIIFFVSISNIMISVHRKHKNEKQQMESSRFGFPWQYIQDKEHLNQFSGLVKHPVIIATFLGLVLNFAFSGKIPEPLHQPIKVAAATIPGIALALLGFSFVRKERYLISSAFVPAMVLVVLKMVVTPVLLHSIVRILTEESESIRLLPDFALLYGIISPATAVFQSGLEFRKSLAVMSVALILTSFSCFPISYIMARVTIAPVYKLSSYVPLLKEILFWTSCASIFSDVIVWITLIWKKQWQKFPGCYIMYLAFTQCLTSCGVLFWSLIKEKTWTTYCQMALYYGGEVSGYIWIGTLAAVLILKKHSMIAEKGFSILSFTALSISVLITAVMCCLIQYDNVRKVLVVGRARSNFELLQLVMTTILLFISLILVFACSIYNFKSRRLKEITDVHAYLNSVFYIQEEGEDLKCCNKIEIPSPVKEKEELGESDEAKFYYHEMLKYNGSETSLSSGDREWTNRLRNLILMQGLVMFVRFVANLFKLAGSKALEVMIPMEFLQSVLFIGQGIFLLFIFGVDVRTATISLRKWLRNIRVGADEILPDFTNIDAKGEIAQFCNKFYNFYFGRCFHDLAEERRWKDSVYKNSFWGHQLVDWMISEGICKDDTEAEQQSQKLLTGGVIRHVTDKHLFYDAPYLYYFVMKNPEKTVWCNSENEFTQNSNQNLK